MEPAALIGAAREAFDEARRRAGGSDVNGRLAGRSVVIRTAGDFFAGELLRGLAIEPSVAAASGATGTAATGTADTATTAAATTTAGTTTALTLHAWDAASTGARLPTASWHAVQLGPSGVVVDAATTGYHVSFDVYGALLSVLDVADGAGYHYLPDPSFMPYWERTHPARLLLSAWLRSQRLLVCHAAAVTAGDGGVLLVGASGAGKSTTSLVCLADGMRSAGDDYVVVEPGTPPIVHALYTSTLLERSHAARHRQLMPTVDRFADDGQTGRSKAIMFASGADRPALSGGFALHAVAALRVEAGAQPAYRRTGAGSVLRALAPSTLGQLGMVDAAGLRGLADLCRSLPCFELRLGDDPAPVPALVRRLIDEARQSSPAPAVVGG